MSMVPSKRTSSRSERSSRKSKCRSSPRIRKSDDSAIGRSGRSQRRITPQPDRISPSTPPSSPVRRLNCTSSARTSHGVGRFRYPIVVPDTDIRFEENESLAATASIAGPSGARSGRGFPPSSRPHRPTPSTSRLSRWRRAGKNERQLSRPRIRSIEKAGGGGPISVGSLPSWSPRRTNSPSARETSKPLAATGRPRTALSRSVTWAPRRSGSRLDAAQKITPRDTAEAAAAPANTSRNRRFGRFGAGDVTRIPQAPRRTAVRRPPWESLGQPSC